MFGDLSKRNPRRRLLLEFTPHQVLAAEVSRPHRGRLEILSAEEFDRADDEGLDRWLSARTGSRVICGLVPRRGVMHRELLELDRLGDPSYLANIVEEQQRGQFLTATPFKVVDPEDWTLRAVNALDGAPLPAQGEPCPALVCGMANEELQKVRQQLAAARVTPHRFEASLLSLFGALHGHMERRSGLRAVAIVVLQESFSAVYVLGKEGVHTPNAVQHGIASIVQTVRRELNLLEEDEARDLLEKADPSILRLADRLVRRIGRDLKPLLDAYEMNTGQPLDEVFCAYLPPKLAWLAEPLARATGRVPMAINCHEWLATVRLQLPPSASFGSQWLGALNLMTGLHQDDGDRAPRFSGDTSHWPWHIAFEPPALAGEQAARRRHFVTTVIAASLVTVGAAATGWQLHLNGALRLDLQYWEQAIAQNRGLFDQLAADQTKRQLQSLALERAHALMVGAVEPSDFILELGRTVMPQMRIDRIETNDVRATISGAVLEPAAEATVTLGRYMDHLRQKSAIAKTFPHISITSLQRNGATDSVTFEITLRTNLPSS